MTTRIPIPAYQDTGVLYGDKELYARIGKIAEGDGGKKLIEEFEIPIRSGKAWVVKKGMFWKMGDPEMASTTIVGWGGYQVISTFLHMSLEIKPSAFLKIRYSDVV